MSEGERPAAPADAPALPALAASVLARLRDPEADFELQALVRGQDESVWLTRRGPRLTLRVLGPGGGEIDWTASAQRALDPQRAFDELGDRIDLVVLYAGGPFPDELMDVFAPDESGPTVRYRASWDGWAAFRAWLSSGR